MAAAGSSLKSRPSTLTTTAAFALGPPRACRLMPLVTTPPASLAAAQTEPPGHMQKV